MASRKFGIGEYNLHNDKTQKTSVVVIDVPFERFKTMEGNKGKVAEFFVGGNLTYDMASKLALHLANTLNIAHEAEESILANTFLRERHKK